MSVSELLDDPAFRTIVDRFVAETPDRLSALRAAVEGQCSAEAQRLSHQLKGAGGSFGFPSITSAAALVENDCMAGKATEEALSRLEEACQQVIADWSAAPTSS